VPLVRDEGFAREIQQIEREDPPVASEVPTTSETFGAAFRVENSLVSAAANGFGTGPSFETEEGYDPYGEKEDGALDIDGYEMFAESFIESRSPAESNFIKLGIDRELEDRKTLEAAGGLGIAAQFAAGALDPLFMIPIGKVIQAGRLTRAGTIGTFAAVGGVSELAAEMVKHQSQQVRTADESAINIGSAALLSGILGNFASGFSRDDMTALSARMEEITDPNVKVEDLKDVVTDGSNLSGGAAKVREVTLEEETLVSAGGLEKLPFSPLARVLNSPSKSARIQMETLSENPLLFKKNLAGMATGPEGGSVETRVKLWDAALARPLVDLDQSYLKYRGKSFKVTAAIDTMLGGRKGKLSYDDFRVEVGKAMRRGDVHEVPEIAAASKSFRKHLFDPLKDDAIKNGLLPADVDVTTATSYLTRVYNTQKIIAERPAWDSKIFNWLSTLRRSNSKRLDKLKADLEDLRKAKEPEEGGIKSLQGKIEKASALGSATDRELQDIVNQITDQLTGNSAGRGLYEPVPLVRGPLKERTLNIPDEQIEEFLESDIDLVARQYKRTMAADVEVTRAFGRADMRDQIDEIKSDYADLREAAKKKNDSKLLRQLNKKEKQDVLDLEAVRDMLRGTYRTPENPDAFFIRAGRVLRDANFVRMLGGMTLSAIPDISRLVAVNGLKPVSRALTSLITSPKTFQMSREEAKRAAVGLDMVLNSRASSLAELTDIYSSTTRFERGLRGLSDGFSKITLMAPWNAALKQFAGVTVADRILTESVNLTKGVATKSAITRLATAGIDKELAERIVKEFNKHGDKGTINLSNGHLWEDADVFEVFRAAVLKDVDRTILTPGIAEKPLWTSSETGKLIFQFKTFAAVAHSKVLVADLQYRDAAALNGFLMAVALGGAAYGAKQLAAGKELSTDPLKLLVESMDRSGTFAYFWDINNITEKLTRGTVGVNAAIGAAPMSRYATRNVAGALLGPSLGTVQDLSQVIGALSTGDLSKSDVNAMRKMLPYQNLFYIRRLLNELEEKAATAAGAQ
jgi:hypothetical protein